jgi:hypothetical protein
MPDYAAEFEAIAKAYEQSGGDPAGLINKTFASLVVSHNRILHSNSIPGVRIEGEETPTGARARITVEPRTWSPTPFISASVSFPRKGSRRSSPSFTSARRRRSVSLRTVRFPTQFT